MFDAKSAPQNLLLLDSNIRDWVVLPLLVIMIAAGLVRHHLSVWLRTTSKPIPHHDVQARNLLQRVSKLHNLGTISKTKWEARRRYYSTSLLREEVERMEEEKKKQQEEQKSTATDDFNPMASMMDSVKGNAVFMVQNMVMMQGISFFFQGYVLLKVPFPLTNGFKMMFQRGLDLSTLDTSYVSSVSWYFLVMFGLRAFFRLAIGDLNQETQESMITQHNFGFTNSPPNPQNKFNPEQALKTEADNLEFLRQVDILEDVEKRLLGDRYPKKKKFAAGDDIFGLEQNSAITSKLSNKSKGAAASSKKSKLH